MPKPRSPLDKPGSTHARRPSSSKRTHSSEKVPKESSASPTTKHGLKLAGHVPTPRQLTMPAASTGAKVSPLGDADMKRPARSPASLSYLEASAAETYERIREGTSAEQLKGVGRQFGDSEKPASPSSPMTQAEASAAAEEVDRLKEAVDSQLRLTQQRERLAKHLSERDMPTAGRASATGLRSRVSPIHEEATLSPSLDAAFASPFPTGMETTSTESAKTVRGGTTPAATAVRTPSYPFPSMKTPRQSSFGGHRPFTALSPTVPPRNYIDQTFNTSFDRLNPSGSSTPASTMTFQPSGTYQVREDPRFPSPNLYDLSLMLSAEPGLDPWWTTVVQIMRTVYKADRVTLAVPADTSDIENVPWGQKATFNTTEEDALSLTYLPRGSSLVPSSDDMNDAAASEGVGEDDLGSPFLSFQPYLRPGLQSRHSFTAYENTKRAPPPSSEAGRLMASRKPALSRSKSHFSGPNDQTPRLASLQNAEAGLATLEARHTFEEGPSEAEWTEADYPRREARGRMFPVLQALDYEADPLIDSSGIIRVLDRGRVVALTRDYPYLDDPAESTHVESKVPKQMKVAKEQAGERGQKIQRPELISRLSSFLSSNGPRGSNRGARPKAGDKSKGSLGGDDEVRPPQSSTRYEEYEQAPPSPWSQSPAPSPAIRADPTENPFFANASVDESSFNPDTTPQDYSKMESIEAIGVDRSCTVLHIPLIHPLLSKPVQSSRLDTAALESKVSARDTDNFPNPKSFDTSANPNNEQTKEKQIPIAILSIISPIAPYPSNLRHSIEHLAPHLATTFSLCRHSSSLETEVAGLTRRRPHASGFGAVAPGGRALDERIINLNSLNYLPSSDDAPQRSTAGSMTSPSDYSGVSRSNAGSPAITPGWDPGNLGLSMDRRSAGGSPGLSAGDSYFAQKARPSLTRLDTEPGATKTSARRLSKELSPDLKHPLRSQTDEHGKEQTGAGIEKRDDRTRSKLESEPMAENLLSKQVRIENTVRETATELAELHEDSSPRTSLDGPHFTRRPSLRGNPSQGPARPERHVHTQLHSYGADFSSTFQSLPSTTAGSIKPAPVRFGSSSGHIDMPPPSDRLKTLMLDTLPAHLFVALPQTGEIVWVNNRYLTYRGRTLEELFEDPWGSLHPDEREDYLQAWSHALRTGEQFSMQVRIRRFDGNYRWFYTRAVGGRDTRGVIVQWYGSYMDIHDQHIAEVKAARQEEIEASEAKHRLLANLIPQIIFAATEDEGVTFANEQWLSYTGQSYDDALGLGFMDFVHPEDLAKCRIPVDRSQVPNQHSKGRKTTVWHSSQSSSGGASSSTSHKSSNVSDAPTETTIKGVQRPLSRNDSSSSESIYDVPSADLSQLARNGVVKVTTDSNGRLSYTTEVRLRSKNGEYRWHLVRCVEVDNINFGSGDGSWFGACTDINDHKLLETKLKEAMESKGKFLSNMSHEIRTPLIGISGMVSFLQDTPLNEEQLDYTNTIQTSANSLLMIINDILDLSKVDAGMMKLSHEWFHTRSLIEDVNELVSTMAISKRLELNYVVEQDVPPMVKGDKVRIRQVLLNVIGNAIKFTSVGEVFSRCRVSHDSASNVGPNEIMLEYSIIDTGAGFTKEEAELIFKPFSQIDGSSTRQHGGSGLGLVISRQLVELHGGTMVGSAVPGEGSVFTFTARFGLPTDDDRPDPPNNPVLSKAEHLSNRSPISVEVSARAMKSAGGNPILAHKFMASPGILSTPSDSGAVSPAVLSSASSDPSVRSLRTQVTDRSSVSSINASLSPFGEAAKAVTAEISNMKLNIPEKLAPDLTPIGDTLRSPSLNPKDSPASDVKHFRPPMYSILIICPQNHSREATTKHIEMTLPKEVPHQITALASVAEAERLIGGEGSIIFTHIVLNLSEPQEVTSLVNHIFESVSQTQTSIVILSDPVQRQAVMKLATNYDYDELAKQNRVTFVYKPVKPSRFAVIFDPDKERDLSTDRNRSSAQQQVATQKQNYVDVEKRLGNKGHKVLLVEDNLVNQKVLLKYLSKVGIAVDMALDGVECTEKVFANPHGFYSLILCDLHMPRKDGYQSCRDIRGWENKNGFPPMPIIALSANVMADVLEKCVTAGFNNYVTKPVDFKELSSAMSDLLDPQTGTKTIDWMRPRP
ncbi:MAG: hypothetical protein M1818_000726 [Claussenomyces sp. TS43310]|nr:MAG: hypothetical protein M1818_000726 [Claussenomyces sp. TS43310]